VPDAACKICGSESLQLIAHTAQCERCGVLLYYPYPGEERHPGEKESPEQSREKYRQWYLQAARMNHLNFTNAIHFTVDGVWKGEKLTVLDYGGGGGQFALVLRSHFYNAEVYMVDIDDHSLVDEWSCMNRHVRYADFRSDPTQFDFIFLNDVFEHVADPVATLRLLSGKLAEGGKIFIDTPRQFWLYPVLKWIARRSLYETLLRGTVSTAHLQIWSQRALERAIRGAGLRSEKSVKISEFTMPPDFYLDQTKISNPLLRTAGRVFYRLARYIAKNKILCVLSRA
jgi:2-polyprenyl-3-methyl-5-hydroxy-6-metoxy-1,4-benzoquinol methylase